VCVPGWRAALEPHETALAGVPVTSLVDSGPVLVRRLAARLHSDQEPEATEDQRTQAELAPRRCARRHVPRARMPRAQAAGEPIWIEGPGGALDPFQTVQDVLWAKIEPATWRRMCGEFQAEDAVLAPGTLAEITPEERWQALGGAPSLAASGRPTPRRTEPAGAICCWSCRQPLPVTEARHGHRIRCPECGTSQKLPG
jgi:hypothetical protein